MNEKKRLRRDSSFYEHRRRKHLLVSSIILSSVSKKKFHSTASFESTIQATSKIVLFETAEHIFANEWL